jgi:protein-disulfide isomerase
VRILVALVLAACTAAELSPPANRAAGPALTIRGDSIPHVGDPNARVVIVSYFNYQCAHCTDFEPKLDAISRRFGNRIVVYYKWLKLKQLPGADAAMLAALAAHRQGKFLAMHRVLLATTAYEPADLRRYARDLGLDGALFERDLADPKLRARLDQDTLDGEAVDVDHVPMLFIDDVEYKGELEIAPLASFLERKLAG